MAPCWSNLMPGDTKISAMTELAEQPADGDLVPIVDVSAAAGSKNKRVTVANLLLGASGGGGGGGTLPTIVEQFEALTVDPDADHGKIYVCYGSSFPVTFPDLTEADHGAQMTFILYKTDAEVVTFAKDVSDYWLPVAGPPSLDTDGDCITVTCYYPSSGVGFLMLTNRSVA